MAIQKVEIETFLDLANQYLVLDVRSPGEYMHAHIPGARSFPLFTDEERIVVGTAYKQQSKQEAIKIGLDFFGIKMRGMIESLEAYLAEHFSANTEASQQQTILLHCWRGGMRSAGLAWLLDLYGYKVYSLIGGYKAYRHWVLEQIKRDYAFQLIGGYTGSGKTLILKALYEEGSAIIDLESLANHKGSALGGLGQKEQPSQEMFENLLAQSLFRFANKMGESIFIEDESQRIGNLQIPMPIWNAMRKCPVFFIEVPFEERLNYITKEYAVHPADVLIEGVLRIQKRLGGLETKNAIQFLKESNFKEGFRILLTYYDKHYKKGLYNREDAEKLIKFIPVDKVDTKENCFRLKENIRSAHGKN